MSRDNIERITAGQYRINGSIVISIDGTGLWWHAEDIDGHNAKGACLRGYKEDDDFERAYVVAADVTNDPEEPLIEDFSDENASKIDKQLEMGIRRYCETNDFTFVKWMGSLASKPTDITKLGNLVSSYIVHNSNSGECQRMALRTTHAGRKIVVECSFNFDYPELLDPMFKTLHSVYFVE